MSIVLTDDKHYKNIAQTIRDNKELMGQLFPSEMADAINQACAEKYEAGKLKMWESFRTQPNGTERTVWNYKFYNWKEDLFYPPYDIKISNPSYMFEFFEQYGTPFNLKQRLEECGKKLDFSLCTANAAEVFYGSRISHIPYIDFSNLAGVALSTFVNCLDLVEIVGIKSNANITWRETFKNCSALTNIRFDGAIGKDINFADSPLLTSESVDSIINALKQDAGNTITFHKDIVLTDTQKATITGKGWSIAQ